MNEQITSQLPSEIPMQLPPQSGGFYRRHTRSLWLSLITIALAVAALLIYILFFRKIEIPPQYTGDVGLTISAPEESVSGSQISYEITVKNLSSAKLTNVDLEIFYPEGFSFIQHLQEGAGFIDSSGDGRQFTFPDVPGNAEQKLVVIGQLKGNIQEIKSITAKLHYVPENFASSFLAAADAATVMLPPEITMRVLAPAQLISGQVIKYEIGITNVSINDFDDLVLELSYPPGFSFTSAVPKPSEGGTFWQLPRLKFGAVQNIIIEGRLSAAPGEDVYIEAELLTEKDGEKLSAGRSYAFTRMLDAPIKLEHVLREGPGTVLPGERLAYEVSYENIGDVGLENVAINMIFETPVFDLLKADGNGGQILGNKMLWQPAAVPELRIVNPGSKGKFTVLVNIRDEKLFTQKNPIAQTKVEFRADTLPEILSGNTLAFKVGTNITLGSQTALISGPSRPEIGQTSVYRVTLTVKNSVNDLENGEFTAVVPRTDVAFFPSSVVLAEESGNFQYLSSSRRIIWKLGKISAFAGVLQSARTVTFDLSITPETPGDGNYDLLKDLETQGFDAFTGELVFAEKIRRVDTR